MGPASACSSEKHGYFQSEQPHPPQKYNLFASVSGTLLLLHFPPWLFFFRLKHNFSFLGFKILLTRYCHLVHKAERRGLKPITSLKTSFLALLLNKRENTGRLLRTAGQAYDQMQTGGNVQAGCCWATSLMGKTRVTQQCPFQTIVSYKLIY